MTHSTLHSFRRVFPLLTLTGVLAVACGSSVSQIVKSFSFNLEERKAQLVTEFSTEVALNMEVAIPIRDIGWVRLIPAVGQRGFQIATDIDFSAFVDPALAIGRTRTLPNGVSFPSYVSTDLYSVELKKDQNFSTKFYLGTSSEKKYVGVGLELKFVDSRFPEGLAISQNLQDASRRNVGVVSFYGPKMSNGRMVAPGGIFIASDINALRGQSAAQGFTVSTAGMEMQSVELSPYDGFDVEGKNSRTYKRPDQQFRLFNKFRGAGRQAGLVD
ncbi:MAG: hypothetical protein FJY29_02180 [Betaproteobacteria bacterium]|nr:hypothetical protein [Betaproteobacteria bacterium]